MSRVSGRPLQELTDGGEVTVVMVMVTAPAVMSVTAVMKKTRHGVEGEYEVERA